MGIITEIGQALTAFVTMIMGLITSSVGGMIELFWASPDGTAPEKLTVIGVLALMALAYGFVRTGMKFVQKFFNKD